MGFCWKENSSVNGAKYGGESTNQALMQKLLPCWQREREREREKGAVSLF
jgi:hypothetical protein